MEKFPENPQFPNSQANVLKQLGKFEEAEIIFEQIIDKYPEKVFGYQGLAQVAMQTQNWQLALQRWEVAVENFPEESNFLLSKINVLLSLNNYAEAQKSITTAKSLFPTESTFEMAEANFYQKQYDYQKAKDILVSALLKYSGNIDVCLTLARNYLQLGDIKNARILLEDIKENVDDKNQKKFINLYLQVLRIERSFNFRRGHIIRELNFDIDKFNSPLEKAIASFLGWNKIVELRSPDLILKVEDCVDDVVSFVNQHSLAVLPENISDNIVVDTQINHSLKKFSQPKPEFSVNDYKNIDTDLRVGLLNFCKAYGYDGSFLG
ncbi:MAG: tetratricopeptide repeat protein [Microcoleaceae cyanobacterium]